MNKDIYNLLDIISNLGYKSYIVGGYVRDLLWHIDNHDLDIVTNAPADLLLEAFKDFNPCKLKYDTIKFKYNEYDVDIAQIRDESYINGLLNVTFTDDLEKDYLRRDFTFNAIYMDKNNNYIDFGDCLNDSKTFKLKFISDANKKCVEDPTRIIRAIYFVLKYNLKSYDELFNIKLTEEDFNKCDKNLLNKCLYKILKLNKNEEFILLINRCNIFEYLFTNNSSNYNLKPKDFIKEFGYKYGDTISN